MKCKGKDGEQHEIMAKANGEPAKFCGECGAEPAPEPGDEMRKCAACDHDMLVKARFCNECGAAQTTTVEALDATAAEIADFAKARVYEAARLEPPLIEDAEIDDARIDAIMAKAQVQDQDGNVDIDAMPVVAEFLKAEQATQQFLERFASHVDARFADLGHATGLVLKAVPLMAAMLKAQAAELTKVGGQPVGRRAVAAVIAGQPDRPAMEYGTLAGDDLMAKCLVATDKDGSLLSSNDFSKLETLCSVGHTLKSIYDEDPELGAKTSRALASITH